jgi:hypothetical protein
MWISQSTQSCRDGGQPAVIRGVIIYVAVLYLMANKLNEQAKFASKFSYIFITVVLWRSQLDKWGGGDHIHIFVFTDLKNNQFQKKLIMQNTNV